MLATGEIVAVRLRDRGLADMRWGCVIVVSKGIPAMRKGATCLLALMLALLGRQPHGHAQTLTSGIEVTFPAGWNLVSLPAGTSLSGIAGPLYTFQPGDTSYETVQPAQGTRSGVGYWAYFPADTTVTLATGNNAPMQMPLPAGQWVMIGDPSGAQWATVSGTDAAYYYDTRSGYTSGVNCISQCTNIAPSEGVWVYSAAGATLTITLNPMP